MAFAALQCTPFPDTRTGGLTLTFAPGARLGPYEITAAIGAGGMGEVWRATDTRLGRHVALKLLPSAFATDPDRVSRFEREAKLLASLNHSTIAHLYGFEQATLPGGGNAHLLAMELVEGEDLAERLKRGPVPVDEALAIARQIAEALEEAHEKGIVHRDLKPANVKVTPDGKVKVLDFGLAKAWTGEGPGATSSPDLSQSPTLAQTGTAAGLILGTAAYMSPEQARGKAADKRADIWAFGVVLWEMLTGRRLFAGETVSDVLAAILTREPDWAALPPAAQGRVRALLRRCLERAPRQRLHDIADARLLLEEAISGAADEASTAVSGVVAAPRRQKVLLAALAALALATAGLAWALLRGRSPEPPRLRSLSVVLPENLWLADDRLGAVAISPDGTRIVITAEDEGTRRLYLRELGSPEWRVLPGSDGAAGPFFSPDGRWVAFDRGGLHKLSLDGGAPVRIAPAIFGAGTWSPSGRIYFTPTYDSGLSRLDAAGGTAQVLTRADPGQGELNHSYPELLPGEKAVLFTSHRATMAESRIEAVSLASGERHVVVEHAIEGRYLRPGYLAFVRDETLMVAPFDAETLRLTGPELPARHEVAVGYGSCHAEYALSGNGTLALVPREVMPARREVVRLDRVGRAETILPAEKAYGGPALSPDGRQLALTRNEGGPGLLLYDLEHRATARLAATPRREFGAVWDRSGTRVFFVVDTPHFQIFEVAASGSGEPKILLEGTKDQIPQDVSPDGQWLLYLQEMQSLGILPLAQPSEQRLFRRPEEGAQNFGRFSPDGRFVAFQSNESGRDEIYVRPVSETARSLPVSRGGGQQPRWAASGEVFFWQGDQLFVAPVRTAPVLQVGEPRPLFRTARGASRAFFEGDYDVSTDGQSIYLARTPDLLRPREVRVVLDWGSEVPSLFARGGGS